MIQKRYDVIAPFDKEEYDVSASEDKLIYKMYRGGSFVCTCEDDSF